MRNRFDEQLLQLNRKLIEMGALCEDAIKHAVDGLIQGDSKTAKIAENIDQDIDQMERDIEAICLKMLLQQQPVARDLRSISAALKMITDMERIGDQASDIAEIVGYMKGRKGEECQPIGKMAKEAAAMVTESIEAYVKKDLDLAQKVINNDDIVDNYFSEAKDSLIKLISAEEADGEYAVDLLMIAKYFERIGDHAVNIAEWVQFSVTGVHKGDE